MCLIDTANHKSKSDHNLSPSKQREKPKNEALASARIFPDFSQKVPIQGSSPQSGEIVASLRLLIVQLSPIIINELWHILRRKLHISLISWGVENQH